VEYRVIRLERQDGIALTIADRGATWLSCEVPLPDGTRRETILRRSAIDDASADRSYLGATVGRYANRIAQGRLQLEGHAWQLETNPASPHQLHGGPQGFHSRVWTVHQVSGTEARFSLHSPEGDQGYPGDLQLDVTYRLAEPLAIEMEMRATASAPTPLAVTNHAYFNLDGSIGDVRAHSLQVQAARYMPVDGELIPVGPPAGVEHTTFDFRQPKTISRDWLADAQQRLAGGYDHAFLLDEPCAGARAPAVQLLSSRGDLGLAISTTLPALQVYAGQYLGGTAAPGSAAYPLCAGVALEPGFLPDSPNHPEWPQPTCWLRPGEVFLHTIRYAFRAALNPPARPSA